MPVKPAVRRIRTVANRDDPRYRRTREQICAATLRLLDDSDPGRLTFAQVATAADVNRSTVHQHYSSRHELVVDALAGELAAIAEPLDRCRLDGRPPVPSELVAMFAAIGEQRPALQRLSSTDRDLLAARLADLLGARLRDRFQQVRPAGFAAVSSSIHAAFVAAGLARLLLAAIGTDRSLGPHRDPVELAEQAWRLIAPVPAG